MITQTLHAVMLAASVIVVGCASPGAGDLETLVTQNDLVAVQEKQRADQLLSSLEDEGAFVTTPVLNSYVQDLLVRLYPERHADFQVRIARLRGENAFALSNGVVVMHLGLVAALENEHQLAFVLAHEIEHINARHGYLGAHLRRSTRVKAHLTDLLTFGSGFVYRYYADGLRGASREQELEADRRAARVVTRAGFELVDAVQFFSVLEGYPNPLRVINNPATHPENQVRKNKLLALAPFLPVREPIDGSNSEYTEMRRQLLRRSINDKLADIDFLAALIQLNQLHQLNQDDDFVSCARGHAYYRMGVTQPLSYAGSMLLLDGLGEVETALPGLFTQMSSRRYFLNRAMTELKALETRFPDSACAARGLGLLHHAMGQSALAAPYLRAYLARVPTAIDRRYVVDILRHRTVACRGAC